MYRTSAVGRPALALLLIVALLASVLACSSADDATGEFEPGLGRDPADVPVITTTTMR